MTKNSVSLNRTLFVADNLNLLESLDNESIDLICIDPPFAKNQTFVGAIRPPLSEMERETERQLLADWGIRNAKDAATAGIEWPDNGHNEAKFKDIWRWENDVHEDWIKKIEGENEALAWTIAATRLSHGEDTAAYLTYMAIRLIEMHRVLKHTGSIYLHCDHSANSYIRMTMDAVFGRGNMRNEIVWRKYAGRKNNAKRKFTTQHDAILFYGKSPDARFNGVMLPHSEKEIEREYKYVDEDGRRYRKSRGRAYQLKGIEKRIYLDESPGRAAGSLWVEDGLQINTSSSERTGYPTQKPVALAERIIKASTNPGDIVLDCFAGCAYVPVAAERNGRDWIACDISPRALTVLRRQFAKFRYAVNGEGQGEEPALIADANVTVRSPHDLPARTDESPEPVRTKPLPERKFKVPSSIIPDREMLEFLLDLSGYMAWCCGFANRMPDGIIVRTTNNFHLDHINPKSKQGTSNEIMNRAPLCPRHNILKGNRGVLLHDYRQEIADAGEMLVNTTDELIDLSMAYDAALARHVQAATKLGVQGKL